MMMETVLMGMDVIKSVHKNKGMTVAQVHALRECSHLLLREMSAYVTPFNSRLMKRSRS